jgi:hypothetical protein
VQLGAGDSRNRRSTAFFPESNVTESSCHCTGMGPRFAMALPVLLLLLYLCCPLLSPAPQGVEARWYGSSTTRVIWPGFVRSFAHRKAAVSVNVSPDTGPSCAAVAAASVPCCCPPAAPRVLKPGGIAYMSFSNRCFPTKGEHTQAATRVEGLGVGGYCTHRQPQGFRG